MTDVVMTWLAPLARSTPSFSLPLIRSITMTYRHTITGQMIGKPRFDGLMTDRFVGRGTREEFLKAAVVEIRNGSERVTFVDKS